MPPARGCGTSRETVLLRPPGTAPTCGWSKGNAHRGAASVRARPRLYLLRTPDNRVVFALPFHDDFTLIGTTDHGSAGRSQRRVRADAPRRSAICCAVGGESFPAMETAADMVWPFAGVRPLVDDGEDARGRQSRANITSISTTGSGWRAAAAHGRTAARSRRTASRRPCCRGSRRSFPPWGQPGPRSKPLPGGDVGLGGISAYREEFIRRHPRVTPETLRRLVALYGTRAGARYRRCRIGSRSRTSDRRRAYCARSRLSARSQWARSADDVLWRRTKAGLHLGAAERAPARSRHFSPARPSAFAP